MDRLHIRKTCIACILIFCSVNVLAKEQVNVLSWWGYITPENIKEIEDKCNVSVNVDEYYSNPEFLRRVRKSDYDIAIYSDTVHDTFIKENTPFSNEDIQSETVKHYFPELKKHFSHSDYRSNTTYFQISLTGFLWNSENIFISKNDTIEQIFEKAVDKTVVVLDEPVEVLNLLSKINYESQFSNTDVITTSIDAVKTVFNGTNTVVANSLGTILDKKDFALAFSWSGEALEKMSERNDKFRYTIHPKLSHWSSDLVTLMTDSSQSVCTAKGLASKEFINALVKTSYYISPYASADNKDRIYEKMEHDFVKNFSSLQPLKRISDHEYQDLDLQWQKIKMVLGRTRAN
jgi:spermidine/putrescine-binding protein